MTKWTRKEYMEHITALKSPLEQEKGQASKMAGIGEILRQQLRGGLAGVRGKAVKPQ